MHTLLHSGRGLTGESVNVTALSDLLNLARGDRSTDDLIAAARKAGHEVDRATVFRALKGEHAKTPRESTLTALSAVFGVDVRLLRKAAGRGMGELDDWVPPTEARQLSQRWARRWHGQPAPIGRRSICGWMLTLCVTGCGGCIPLRSTTCGGAWLRSSPLCTRYTHQCLTTPANAKQ